jgi:hypothetical protein
MFLLVPNGYLRIPDEYITNKRTTVFTSNYHVMATLDCPVEWIEKYLAD